MKITKKVFISFVILCLILGINLSQVVAVTVNDDATTSPKQVEVSNSNDRQVIQPSRCDRITDGIKTKTQSYTKTYDEHVDRYRKVTDKMSGLVSRLQDLGIDTTILESSLIEVDAMMLQFKNEYQETLQYAEQMKLAACDDDQKGYNDAKKEVSNKVSAMRTNSQEIKHFMQEDFREVLKDLREQLKELLAVSN